MMEQEIPRVSAEKSNDNFTEVYTLLGDSATLPSGIVTTLTVGTNVTLSGSTGNVTINASITGGSTQKSVRTHWWLLEFPHLVLLLVQLPLVSLMFLQPH